MERLMNRPIGLVLLLLVALFVACSDVPASPTKDVPPLPNKIEPTKILGLLKVHLENTGAKQKT
jgi:hypothetical protein